MGKREKDEELHQAADNKVKKEYLNRYADTIAAVERINDQIKELERTDIFSRVDNLDVRITDNSKRDLSDYLVKKEELLCDMYRARYKRISDYQKIFLAIENIEDEQERQILTLRYIKKLKWEKICVQMHVEWAQVHRIHSKALNDFVIPE